MKRIPFLILVVFATLNASAQFEIEVFSKQDIYDMASEFPLIRSKKKPDAARRVNEVLHLVMLEKVFSEDDADRFDAVFPKEGDFGGAAEFEYEIITNNERYFSVGITCSYTGAYTEYMTRYFNFDAKTGQQIVLSDIFAETPLVDLATWVNQSIESEIVDFIDELDETDEYQNEQIWMYTECLEWISDSDELSENSFYITDSTMVFVRGRCSNHMMAALDDLWDFYVTYPMDQLESMMNDNGIALLNGKALEFGQNGAPEYKILEGTIGDKYPITAMIHNSYETTYSGWYWYNAVKAPIRLSGTINEQTGMLNLTEDVDGNTTGEMEFMIFSDGELVGTWTNAAGDKNLKIVLKPGK